MFLTSSISARNNFLNTLRVKFFPESSPDVSPSVDELVAYAPVAAVLVAA